MYENFMLENVNDIKKFISDKIIDGYLFSSIYGEYFEGSVVKCQTFTVDNFQSWEDLIDSLDGWNLLMVTMIKN